MVFKERRLAAAGTVARAPADDRELHAAFLAAQETASTQTEDGRGPADSSQPVGISEGAASDPRGAMFAVDEDVDRKSRRYSIEMGTADSAENVPPRDAPACLSPGLAAKGAGLSAVRHAVANVERDAASASAPTGRSSMRASQADLEECSCGSAASNVPARVLAARSSDVMVVEWDGDESETSDVEAEVTKATDGREEEPAETKEEPAEAKEDDNENELMSQLLGLWRKLRIENAELRAQVRAPSRAQQPAAPAPSCAARPSGSLAPRARLASPRPPQAHPLTTRPPLLPLQVQETSMAVEEANSQLGVARSSPRNQLPLSPRSLIGSSGSGASTPDGGGSPMGSKAKRGREVAGSSLLRPRKLVAEPDPVPDVDTLKPEELWAMLLREREARDFYRQQVRAARSSPPLAALVSPRPICPSRWLRPVHAGRPRSPSPLLPARRWRAMRS
jgi:hypothetical protein